MRKHSHSQDNAVHAFPKADACVPKPLANLEPRMENGQKVMHEILRTFPRQMQ